MDLAKLHIGQENLWKPFPHSKSWGSVTRSWDQSCGSHFSPKHSSAQGKAKAPCSPHPESAPVPSCSLWLQLLLSLLHLLSRDTHEGLYSLICKRVCIPNLSTGLSTPLIQIPASQSMFCPIQVDAMPYVLHLWFQVAQDGMRLCPAGLLWKPPQHWEERMAFHRERSIIHVLLKITTNRF